MIFVGLGILIGGIIGALTIHLGGVPISLSTSGGALLSGLFFGWLRTKHRATLPDEFRTSGSLDVNSGFEYVHRCYGDNRGPHVPVRNP